MTDSLLIRHDDDGVCTLTLNRPNAYNALSLELMQELIAVLSSIKDDLSIRVVLIQGSGKGFCAGHDLKQMLGEGTEAYYQETFETCSAMMQVIQSLPVPVIAKVHGVATAAGCQLVATCDLAVSSSKSRFATPGVNIGLFCSTPMVAITRSVAPKHAMELLLTGDLINAERAESIGLINWQVDENELDSFANNLACKIASKSRKTLSIGKQAFYQQLNKPISEAYGQCSSIMTENMLIEDAQEGIDAFITKRPPNWKHQ